MIFFSSGIDFNMNDKIATVLTASQITCIFEYAYRRQNGVLVSAVWFWFLHSSFCLTLHDFSYLLNISPSTFFSLIPEKYAKEKIRRNKRRIYLAIRQFNTFFKNWKEKNEISNLLFYFVSGMHICFKLTQIPRFLLEKCILYTNNLHKMSRPMLAIVKLNTLYACRNFRLMLNNLFIFLIKQKKSLIQIIMLVMSMPMIHAIKLSFFKITSHLSYRFILFFFFTHK